jgi:hypothetical protein
LPRPVHFPSDNWLRNDIGLPSIAEDTPAPEGRLAPPAPPCFPTDDRLRDDIGLPPLSGDCRIRGYP